VFVSLKAHQYNDTNSHKLGFRADEDQRTQLDDIQHAAEVLGEAADRCKDSDMRTADVFAALDYLGSIASRKTALTAFRRGLDIEHPDQRGERVMSALRSIKAALP
jgi:hypothetical protein